MDVALVIPAFIAGLLTFLAPCTLPLVPGYLGFISGTSINDLKDPEKVKKARSKIFLNGLFFVIGFSAVFIVFGTLAGFAGMFLVSYRLWLSRIGGVFVILFGMLMLDVLKVPFLAQEKRIGVPMIFERGKPVNSLVFGSAFAFGWTPCVGPILGSILLLASTTATIGEGAVLLAVFSLGLAVPFLLVAWGVGQASRYVAMFNKFLNALSVVGGVFLIFLGVLLLTNTFSLWTSYFYRAFNFIHYNRLLDYL